MSLQSRVVASILRSSCPVDRAPIQVADAAKQLDYIKELEGRLRKLGIPAVMINKRVPSLYFMISVEADLPDFQDGYDDLDHFFESLDVLFVNDTLHIQNGHRDDSRVAVADVEQIQRATDAVHARLTKQAHHRQKTAKVRELKHKFVAARIQELHSQYKFGYHLKRMRTMAWLSIETMYDIDIVADVPYDAVMPCMEIIESVVADVYERKRRPKYKQTLHWDTTRHGRWWLDDKLSTDWDKGPFGVHW
jgi:hypothetical protein